MERQPLTLDADVTALPHGTKVGVWLLKGCRGRGAYGTVYRAVREGDEAAGPVALKPPFTDARTKAGECWQEGGSGPRPPREMNPRVDTRLDAAIRRMLSLKPEERGTAGELAEALERGADQAAPELDEPLFEWETLKPAEWPQEDLAAAEDLGHRARRRKREVVHKAVAADAAKQAEAERQKAEARTRAQERLQHGVSRARGLPRLLWLAATVAGVMVMWPWDKDAQHPEEEPMVTQRPPRAEQRDGGSSYVGDTALLSAYAPMKAPSGKESVAEEPPKPLPGQLKPDAKGRCSKGQVVLNGGCWMKAGVEPKELSPNVCGVFPPRPEGRLKPTRSASRPERHFHDSFISARLAMARVIATWLPRCPSCHRSNSHRSSRNRPGLPVHPAGP